MSIEQGEIQPEKIEKLHNEPVITKEFIQKLHLNEASLLDGITNNLSAEDLKQIYDQIFEYRQMLAGKNSAENISIWAPKWANDREQQEKNGKFINQLETFIARDYFQTHGLAQSFAAYQELATENFLHENSTLRSNLLDEISNFLESAKRPEIYQTLDQMADGAKLALLKDLAIRQSIDAGNSQIFDYLSESVLAQDNSPFTSFIVKYCHRLNQESQKSRKIRSLNAGEFSYLHQDSIDEARHWSARESQDITDSIRPEQPLAEGEQIVHIAKDAVAIIAKDGEPRAYAPISERQIKNSLNTKINTLDGFIELYSPLEGYQKDPDQFSIHKNMDDLGELIWNLERLNSEVICSYYKLDSYDFESLGKIWQQISPVMTAEEWKDLFEQMDNYSKTAEQNYENIGDPKYREIVEILNDKIESQYTRDTLSFLEKIRPEIVEQIPKIHFQNYQELARDHVINPFDNIEDDLAVYFSFLHNPVFQIKIEQEFGLDLTQIDLASQIHLLRFLVHTDEQTLAKFTSIANDTEADRARPVRNDMELKDNFLKSFLACADDLAFGKKIIDLYEKYETKAEYDLNGSHVKEYSGKEISAIFNKYAEIVDAVENVRNYLSENYHGQTDSQTIDLITQNFLRKGKDLLSDFADNPRKPEEVIKALEDYKTETLIFASTCRALKQEGQQINLEDFKQYGVDVLPATEIAPEDQQAMTQILSENWKSQDPDLAEYALDSLQKSFTNRDSRFYILRYAGQVLGFKRFDNMENNDLYAGSFNINSRLRRSGIGEAAMRAYLSQEAQDHTVHADASPFTPITMRYIGEFGFVGTDIKDMDYKGKQFSLLGMERNDKLTGQYHFINASYGEIAKNYHDGDSDQGTGSLVKLVNQEELLNQMREVLLSGDLALTAYRPNPDNPKEYLLAFERKAQVENKTEFEELAAA